MANRGHHFAGEDLTCIRGERVVFSGLSFRLEAGDALVLRGPNGAGKSSLLRLAAGLLPPARGRITWDDGGIEAEPETHRSRLVYVGHQDAVKPVLTVAENLAFWARLAGAPGAVAAALEGMGIAGLAALPARRLSAGQRRRLALARLYLRPAPLWLLDEPTVGLDREATAALMAAVDGHRNGGGLLLIAAHAELDLPGARALDLAEFAPAPAAAWEALAS